MPHTFLHTYTWNTGPDSGLVVKCCAESINTGKILSTRISQPYWVIDYSATDMGLVRVGSTNMPWIRRPANTAHIYAPNTPYWEDSRDNPQPIHSAYVCFWHGEIAGLDRFTANRQHYAQIMDSQDRILHILQKIAETGRLYGESGQWKAQSELCKLLDLLQYSINQEENIWQIKVPERYNTESELVYTIRRYLMEHIDEQVTLQQIADHANISISTLSHSYRQQTGETPLYTHLAMRMEKVKHSLRMGTPLKTIAEQMGFCDIYHLSKTFSRVTGTSPRKFLKLDISSE